MFVAATQVFIKLTHYHFNLLRWDKSSLLNAWVKNISQPLFTVLTSFHDSLLILCNITLLLLCFSTHQTAPLPNRLKSLCGDTSPVESIAFDSAEVFVVGGAAAGAVKLWDLEEVKRMDAGGSSQPNEQEKRASRRVWTKEEEEALLGIIDEIVANGGRADCGSFKAGTFKIMEMRLSNILPNCGLRASPHIESKVKSWKKDYGVIYDMKNTSGFGWNNEKQCIEVDSHETWNSYVQHHKQAKGWRDKPFPLYERLEYIFGKDRATGKTAYTPENLAADIDVDENSENDVEMLGNFSPMSVNQTDSTQPMNQASSQPSSRKRSRSGDPIIRSMDRITNVLKEAMDKTNETLDKFTQVLANNKVNENHILAADLQKMQLPLLDQIRVMQKFMQKPEIAEVFKAQPNEEQKLQFIASILSGAFD